MDESVGFICSPRPVVALRSKGRRVVTPGGAEDPANKRAPAEHLHSAQLSHLSK